MGVPQMEEFGETAVLTAVCRRIRSIFLFKQHCQNSDTILPYHLIADDAFPLKSYIMKPFPHRNIEDDQAIYNYRLSRGRRLIGEHSYVIMLYAK